jgi:hypothetical protein
MTHHEDTIEVELSSQDLLALTRPRVPEERRCSRQGAPPTPMTRTPSAASPMSVPSAASPASSAITALAARTASAMRRVEPRLAYGVTAGTIVAVASLLIASRAHHVEPPASATAIVSAAPATVVAASPTPQPAAAPPVKFANPFDRSEVFEFPAGTSRAEARQKVAELLIKRAQERHPTLRRVASRKSGARPA